MKKIEEEFIRIISSHYGVGDINRWNSPATNEQKENIRRLAATLAKFVKEG